MKTIEINLRPAERELRQFGWIALGAFLALALLCYWRGGLLGIDFGAASSSVSLVLAGLGSASGLLSLLAPRANRPLYVALVVVTYPIGFVLSYLIMAVLFYGIITPVALLCRSVGFDPLKRRFDREAESYWVEVERPASKQRYYKQF
jgi:hypothetical protein